MNQKLKLLCKLQTQSIFFVFISNLQCIHQYAEKSHTYVQIKDSPITGLIGMLYLVRTKLHLYNKSTDSL